MATIISRRYEVIGQLGQGGMGVVYKVRHTALETILALKVLPAYLLENQDIVTRFTREARVMARLNHPNIVRVFDIERDESLNLYYFVMECIEGETLGQYVRKKGPLPLPEIVAIGKQVASALGYAHNHNPPIIHRDIKPSNIMIEARSNRVVVMDFGIAKELDDMNSTKTGAVIGTLKYASPEQLRHEPLEGSADVYSLGMVLYEMYAGKQFFAGLDENAVLGKVLYDAQENAPRFDRPAPAAFVELVTKAIAKTRAQRYQRMADLLRDLEACQVREHQEELKAQDSEKQGRELEKERQLQAQVQESRAQAAQEGAAEWAATLFQQGLAREERARRSLREHSFTAAQQAHREAIALFGQAREEAQKAVSLRKAERVRHEVATAKAEAKHYGAQERARSFYGRGLSLEAQAEDLWERQSYTQAAQLYNEAIRFFAEAREFAYRETLREETEVARTDAATARQRSEDAQKQAEQVGQISDHARVETEPSPKILPPPLGQTTRQSVMGRWAGRAAMLIGIGVVSAAVIWFVALRQESPLHIPTPEVKVSPPSTTTRVSSMPKPAPTELPPSLSLPVPEKEQSFSVVTRPDVTESLRLGQFFQDRGQYDEAIRELEEAKGRDPDNTDIITALKRVRSAKEAEAKLNRSP